MIDYPDGFGPPRQSQLAVIDPVAVLRRSWAYVIAAALLCACAGWGLAGLRTPTYTSSVEIALQPLDGAPLSPTSRSSTDQAAGMNSEAATVTSAAVVRRVSRSLGLHLDLGTGAIHARVVSNTANLVIDFTAATPTLARRGAQLTASTFLQVRATSARAAQLAQLRQDAAQVAEATRTLNRDPKLRPQLIRYASRLQVLGPQLRDVRSVVADPGAVISEPSTPASAGPAGPIRDAALAGLLGLVLAVGLALWRGRRAVRVHQRSLLALRGCPVLPLPAGAEAADDALLANACRFIRAALPDTEAGAVAVCPVSADDRAAADVVQILERSFGRASLRVSTTATATNGSPAGPRVRAELGALSATHDVVLAAGPPAATPDGQAFALAAGQVLLTVREGAPAVRRCHHVIGRLRRLNVEVLAVLVLPAAPGSAR